MISLILGALMISIGCSKKVFGLISGPLSDWSCVLVCRKSYKMSFPSFFPRTVLKRMIPTESVGPTMTFLF